MKSTQASDPNKDQRPILIIGQEKIAASLAVCLSQTFANVTWYTDKPAEARDSLDIHFDDLKSRDKLIDNWSVEITDSWPEKKQFQIAFLINMETSPMLTKFINRLEKEQSEDLIIAISSEYTPLISFQKDVLIPQNIIGANWTEPVHTTFFLELIKNQETHPDIATKLRYLASTFWDKDPYVIEGELGVRSRLIAALIREAFYLIEKGYATEKDIDRACRNDGGTYLPFSGNYQYMDLMGTYAYGLVMKDLNKELSKSSEVPGFFRKMIEEKNLGIKTGRGFYQYTESQGQQIEENFRNFSYAIKDLIKKY